MSSEDPRLLETFRCEHWACTLARKHCVLRQTERAHWATRRRVDAKRGGGARVVTAVPKHPFCASGECAQGREIAAMFPELVALPTGGPKRTAPRLDIVQAAKEETMACEKCGSKTCHKADCPNRPVSRKAPPLPTRPKSAGSSPVRKVMTDKGPVTVTAIRALDTPSLLLVRDTVETELQERLAQVEGEAARLREAVRSATARAADALPKSEAA